MVDRLADTLSPQPSLAESLYGGFGSYTSQEHCSDLDNDSSAEAIMYKILMLKSESVLTTSVPI